MNQQLYDILNKNWKSTCKVLFGEEVGDLKEFEPYLKENFTHVGKRKSHISGKEITLSTDNYPKDANFILLEENKQPKIDPLSINDVKDIDSIRRAVSEKWEYAGNKVLGNSAFVENSDNVTDSQYVADSTDVYESQHVYLSSMVRKGSKCIFGCTVAAQGEYMIRFFDGFNNRRCFESTHLYGSSDVYLSNNTSSCSDMIFCFNQRSKRNCIGNLQLSKERYAELKGKLLAEIRDELRAEKRFQSLFEFFDKEPTNKPRISTAPDEKGDMSQINKAFSDTCKLIFRRDLGDISKYEKWLSRHVPPMKELNTPFGSKTYISTDSRFALYNPVEKKMITLKESIELENLNIHLEEKDITSLDKIKERISDIGYQCLEMYEGINTNIIQSPIKISSQNIYKTFIANKSESCGLSFWIPLSKYQFGGYIIFESEFGINCRNSFNLKRCLELDACKGCSDMMFSHNCENVHDSMFCFNAKNLNHAIGNAVMPSEQYKTIKDAVIGQLADGLERNKELKWDVYDMGVKA